MIFQTLIEGTIEMPNNNENSKDIGIQQVTSVNAVAIVGSVAAEETALASLIQAEANKVTSVEGPGVALDDLLRLNQSVLRTMKTILLKNTVLEIKLRETLNFITVEGIDPLNLDDLIDNVIDLFTSIGQEESALGSLIDRIGVGIVQVAPTITSLDDVIAVNNSVRSIMKVIVQKNMVLLRKLRSTVRFFEFLLSTTGVNLPFDVISALQNTIRNNLIQSISREENGLAQLILGESSKFSRALALGLTVEELLVLNDSVTGVIDTVVQKNMILEAKLEEIVALIGLVDFSEDTLRVIANAFTLIQGSVAQEENALARIIQLEADKLNQIIGLAPGQVDILIDANTRVTTLLESITLKNMILEQKAEEVVNFIQLNT